MDKIQSAVLGAIKTPIEITEKKSQENSEYSEATSNLTARQESANKIASLYSQAKKKQEEKFLEKLKGLEEEDGE